MDMKQIGCEDGGWIYVAQDANHWRALANTNPGISLLPL